jgi:hypothetical protein
VTDSVTQQNKEGKSKMMDLVLEKIDFEYELFFMDMMKSTKENIFAKSREIELKKAIVIFIKDNVYNNHNIKLIKMTTADNLIDEFYRYVIDHEDLRREEAMNKYLDNYIK